MSGIPTPIERSILVDLVYKSKLPAHRKEEVVEWIKNHLNNYKDYQTLQFKLEDWQPGYNDVLNPSATDAMNHVKNITRP